MPEPLWTILDLVRATTSYFESRHIQPARLTAELLLAHALKVRRLDLYLRYDQPCTDQERENYRELVRRRAKNEPCQYIIGQAEFWSLPLRVCPGVFIPRPDTEVLVEEVVSAVKARHPKGAGLSLVDLCTGSGAIALALKKELPEARVVAVERDEVPFAVATENAAALKLEIELFRGDLFAPLAGQQFDVIVSNPPYITSGEIPELPKEVRDYEPHLALDGGADGLDPARRILSEASTFLRPEGVGMVLFEISPEQGELSRRLVEEAGFFATMRKDYEGRDRAAIGFRSSPAARGASPEGREITMVPLPPEQPPTDPALDIQTATQNG
jgi:release factor glutamine methyltransferase